MLGNDLNVILSSERYFRAMTACLATNARAMDHGMGNEDRDFYYDSNRAELKVTLKGNKISQAIEILEYGGYFTQTEKETILIKLSCPKSPDMRLKFSEKYHDDESTDTNEKIPLLKKN